MRLRVPVVPITINISAERRPWRRLTILGLMIVVAVLALGIGVARHSRRWADDWAYDRREAARHRHEGETFYPQVLRGILAYRAQHPSDDGKIWVIHSEGFRVTPELERYVRARITYHQGQAERHERAVGRRWVYDASESPPPPPPVVPIEEVARAYGLKIE